MKFIVEMEDFYLNEDGQLSDSLQKHVTRDVLAQISERIKKQVEEAITKKVEEAMKEKIAPVIDTAIADMIETGVLTVSGKALPIKEHLRSLFDRSHGWNNPHDIMEKFAKNFGNELKARYNNIFAAKIVQNMKDQGFLKDDMARILLEDTK
jgi:hypothetical protein